MNLHKTEDDIQDSNLSGYDNVTLVITDTMQKQSCLRS